MAHCAPCPSAATGPQKYCQMNRSYTIRGKTADPIARSAATAPTTAAHARSGDSPNRSSTRVLMLSVGESPN